MALTQVKAAGLTADLIDETKLADNSIDSEHYNDGSIDNEHLADNAVDSAELAAGSVDIAHLSATGTAGNTTYLRGDNSWQTVTSSDTTYSVSCVDGDNTDEEKIRLTAGGSGSGTDDVVLEAGTGLSIARSGDKITYTNTGATQDTLSFRNLIVNGAMRVAQRATSVTGASSGYNTADRWYLQKDTGTVNQTVESDGPTGFAKSLKILFSDSNSPSSGNGRTTVTYKVEAQDVQKIGYGTAGCLQTTLSFWVKSNVTGTYVVRFYRPDAARVVSGSYTISASATWEKKSITFPADTSGAVVNDNGEGLRLEWGLIVGATESTGSLATTWDTWANNDQSSFTGNVNVGASANNYWQITGAQLETGSTATDFEHRSYGDEFLACQRYYQSWRAGSQGIAGTTSAIKLVITSHTVMRDHPTASIGGTGGWRFGDMVAWAGTASSPTISLYAASDYSDKFNAALTFELGGFSGLTTYRTYMWEPNNTYKSTIQLSSEL